MKRHYETLTPEGVRLFLAGYETLAVRLGGKPAQWNVREVSDGNLNLVFLVHGPDGSVCVKQSLPHVRVDPEWRMPLDRTAFEAEWLRRAERFAPGHVPEFLLFDPDMFVLVMECLDDFVTLRQALGEDADATGPSRIIAEFVTRIAFSSSLLAGRLEDVMPDMALFAHNTTLTRITFDLVLSDPFCVHPRNHWLSELDQDVMALQNDPAIARAMIRLQQRFLTCPQALLHGDLHSGSVMVRGEQVRVIDGEFSLYGPIGFDCGLYLANLVLARAAARSDERRTRLAEAMEVFWSGFSTHFLSLWQTCALRGDLLAEGTFAAFPSLLHAEREHYLNGIFQDMTGFAAAEIIRRTIGYAQVADFDHLSDTTEKAARQREALTFAGTLLRNPPLSMTEFSVRLED